MWGLSSLNVWGPSKLSGRFWLPSGRERPVGGGGGVKPNASREEWDRGAAPTSTPLFCLQWEWRASSVKDKGIHFSPILLLSIPYWITNRDREFRKVMCSGENPAGLSNKQPKSIQIEGCSHQQTIWEAVTHRNRVKIYLNLYWSESVPQQSPE